MKIPVRWLREFVETDAAPGEIADRLTMAGIEMAGVESLASGLAGVVVGEVLDVAPHPAGSLTVCQVSLGAERFGVVCGAPNVRPGVRAAFAPPGAVLPGDRRVGVVTIKGTSSAGMLCSEAELGLGEDAAGVLLLEATVPVGTDLVEHLGLDDVVLDVAVAPNRPDCLSVVGIAREVAALTRGRFVEPAVRVREDGPDVDGLAAVTVEDEELCPRYAARVLTDVTVASSPVWLAQRLRAAGLRPINNVVDVTNYVLWELGHPLHAFDRDLLAGHRIVVRRARAGEGVVTLDGQSRPLAPSMLVIADTDRPVGVAGVMGAQNTEVRAATRILVLESAYFKPGSIRRTARTLGLSTEASHRFERGADIEGLRLALDRAASLISDFAGGRVARGVIDVYPRPPAPLSLTVRLSRIERVLGACPPKPVVAEILRSLRFPIREQGERFEVAVPSFRRDVRLEDDLVEEVARIWGYGEIPSTLPVGTLTLTRRPRSLVAQDAVRSALTAAGCQEAITLSLVDPAYLAHLGWTPGDARVVGLQNPLAADRSILRPTLLFGLLEAIATNVRRQAPGLRLFEIGRVFAAQGAGQLAREETRVGLAMTGLRGPRSWFGGKARIDLFDVKGVVENVVEALGRADVSVDPLSVPYLEEGRAVTVVVQGSPVGVLGELAPGVQQAFELPAPVFVAELSLDGLETLPSRSLIHRPLPRFPGVQRDLAVVLPVAVPASEVREAIYAMPTPYLTRVGLFDVYEGDQVGAGKKSLAYSLLYQAEDRTLTDAEVNAMHREIIERLQQRLGAEVRGLDAGSGA